VVAGAVAVGVLVLPASGSAWSPRTQQAIAADAARLAPPDLAQLMFRHAEELAKGAIEPFSEGHAERHYQNPDGTGTLTATLDAEVAAAIEAIREHHPFAEVVRRLGRVSHWAGDLDNPLNTSAADPEEPRYFLDYLSYAESAEARFAVVVYQQKPPILTPADLAAYERDALARGRLLYPMIGGEYRRVGFASGSRAFDDHSTAFGLASLAYSHSVTDAARLFRYIWISAGGSDPRSVFARARDRVLLLDRGGAP
jgi:hypothetical protein